MKKVASCQFPVASKGFELLGEFEDELITLAENALGERIEAKARRKRKP